MKKLLSSFRKLKLNWKLTFITLFTVMVTLAVLAGVLFYVQEQNVVRESMNFMEHAIETSENTIENCFDSINMSTQFFLADESMLDILNAAKEEQVLSTEDLVDYQSKAVKNLERLVNNNPVLYSVRYYATSDVVQEMMPILYNASRMEKLSWAQNEDTLRGWHFGYQDTAFSALITGRKNELAGLVTPIENYKYGTIGYIEAAVPMESMFPGLYENAEVRCSFIMTSDGNPIYGSNKWDNIDDVVLALSKQAIFDSQNKVSYVSVGKSKIVVAKYKSKKLGVTLVELMDITEGIHAVWNTRNLFVFVMVLVLVLMAFAVNGIVRRMLRQFYVILDSMQRVKDGDLNVRIKEVSSDEMGTLGLSLNNMLDEIQELMQENIDREVLVKNSEIRALQNQINAHFIYNVLESIKMMAEIDGKFEISDAITSLGKLLRYSIRWVSGNVKVSEEIEYIKDYMALINLRYDFPIHLALNVAPEIMDFEIPKMSLQPVIENAILHGIEPMGEESTIYIKGWIQEEDCIIEVSDTGRGMTDAELQKLVERIEGKVEVSGGKGNGIGLKNVHDRVTMAFGAGYGLSVYTKLNCYTKVAIKIPIKDAGKRNGQ